MLLQTKIFTGETFTQVQDAVNNFFALNHGAIDEVLPKENPINIYGTSIYVDNGEGGKTWKEIKMCTLVFKTTVAKLADITDANVI